MSRYDDFQAATKSAGRIIDAARPHGRLTAAQQHDFETTIKLLSSPMYDSAEGMSSGLKTVASAIEAFQASDGDVEAADKALKAVLHEASRPKDMISNPGADLQGTGNGDRDLPPGTVRALKSSEKFASHYGGSTETSLDQWLRASFANNWGNIPTGLKTGLATDALGDLILPVPLSNRIIDLSRAASRVIQAGATTARMDGPSMQFARLKQDVSPGWKLENAQIGASAPTFEPVFMTARTLAAMVVLSVELSEDVPTIGPAIETALVAALGVELDRAALLGSGSGAEPRGLFHTSGVPFTDVSAGLPGSYQDLSRAIQTVREANLEPNAIILGSDVAGELERLTDDIGQPLRAPASVEAIAKYTTTKLNGFAVVGDWSWLLLGMRQDLRIEASRDAFDPVSDKGFPTYSVLVRATLRMDVAVLKPQAFAILSAFTGS
jgi:HK97 family phage major capsid protein